MKTRIYATPAVKGLKLHVWKVGDCGASPALAFRFQINNNFVFFSETKCFSPLTRKYSVLWGTSRDREVPCSVSDSHGCGISNPVFGGQCHLIHLTITRRFCWPSLAYMLLHNIHSFILILLVSNDANASSQAVYISSALHPGFWTVLSTTFAQRRY